MEALRGVRLSPARRGGGDVRGARINRIFAARRWSSPITASIRPATTSGSWTGKFSRVPTAITLRLYDAERNLLTYLVVDKSGSMEFSGAVTRTPPKLEYAARLAAALGYLVLREGDELGLSLVDTGVHQHLPAAASWAQMRRVLDSLGNARAEGKTDLGACLEQIFAQTKRRGVLAVMSDFLDVDARFWKAVDLFRSSRFDVMLFHIVHPEEIDLPAVAAARFMESEGGGRFNAEPDAVRAIYRRRFDAFLSEIKANCQARGCDWYLAKTSDDPYGFLRNCFIARENGR